MIRFMMAPKLVVVYFSSSKLFFHDSNDPVQSERNF